MLHFIFNPFYSLVKRIKQTKKPTKTQFFSYFCILGIVLSWGTEDPVKFTPYQITVWSIRYFESFSPNWYKDGVDKKGHQKYSIGYGYNDWGLWVRRKGINPPITHAKALELALSEIDKMPSFSSDKWVDLAMKLRAYNTGPISKQSQLKGCCGASNGCGNGDSGIRKAHNPRRKFECALASHNFSKINELVAEMQTSNTKILKK